MKASTAPPPEPEKPKKKSWEITIIRGKEVTTQPVPLPAEGAKGI
jgi:hypothetical protein